MTATSALKLQSKRRSDKTEKEPLRFTRDELLWPVLFMLSMSMIGLEFPLGFIFVPLIMFSRFRNDRYDFIVQLTIFLGGYNLINSSAIYCDQSILTLLLGIVAMILVRKTPILSKTTWLCIAYFVAIIWLTTYSDESFMVQSIGFRAYFCIVYLFVPFLVFSGRDFDIKLLFRKLFIYSFIFSAYYLIDSVILGGEFFLPRDPSLQTFNITSTFYDPWVFPFSFTFPRRWPPGLYILMTIVYPAARCYKLSWWQWGLLIGGMMVSRTFTFTLAFFAGYFICRSSRRTILLYALAAPVVGVALYFIDGVLPTTIQEGADGIQTRTTTLRFKSQIDQFIDLANNNADEESLAAIGTGRGAQIIPKMDLLLRMDKEWTGFGFLSRDLTKSNKYTIENDMYGNPDMADEVATGVESVPFQIILDIGIIGLILHVLFFILLWVIIRRLPYSGFFLTTICLFAFIGISGMQGLIRHDTLVLCGLAYAAVILNEKRQLDGFDLPPLKQPKKETVPSRK